MELRAALVLGLVAVSAALAGCAEGASRPDEVTDAADSPQPEEMSYLAAAEVADFPESLDDLVSTADVVAVVEPVQRLPDHWNSLGNMVVARFELRMVRVLAGDIAVGDVLVAHAPGGTAAETFAAHGDQRPREGEPSVVREYYDWPFYQLGRVELVFLKRVEAPALGVFYWNLGPSARYQLSNGKLASIYGSKNAQVDDPGGVRRELTGLSVDDVDRRVKAAADAR